MTKPTRSLLAGIAGGLAGALAMDGVSAAWGFARRKIQSQERNGHDRENREVDRRHSEAIANTKIAEAIARPILHRRLTEAERRRGGQIVHYAYGALLGAAYGLSGRKAPRVRWGHGTMFGLGTGVAGVNLALPLLNMMKPAHRQPLAEHAYNLVSHAAYGAALQTTFMLLDGRPSEPKTAQEAIIRYLEDAIAAEKSFETQLKGFAKQSTIPPVRELFEKHAKETRTQYEDLTERLEELGGSPSGFKSFLAHGFGIAPKTAQLGHEPEERTVQDLMMAYSVENAEVAMYECLIGACEVAGDWETGRVARRIQRQEEETAEKLWPHIGPAATQAVQAATAAGSGDAGRLVLRYLQDAEAAEENFEDALAAFSAMGDQDEVKHDLSSMSKKARTQHERLQKRIEKLGGSRSTGKSALAHLLAFAPTTAQAGHTGSEKNTQHLMITYAAAAAEMAMYEALAAAAEYAGDRETASLARELQKEEKEDHSAAWRRLSRSAKASVQDLVHQ